MAEPPKVTRTTHTLPFERLSPFDFERLCLWLVQREGYKRVEALGEAGKDQGRDIFAWKDGRPVAFQCKRVRQFGPKDAEKEINKIRELPEDEQPDELVFVVSCAVSVNTRKAVRSTWGNDTTCHFWAGNELDERVKRHPDIVEEFFQISAPSTLSSPPSPSGEAPPEPRQRYIFISYVRENKDMIDRLCGDLRSQGLHIWLDRERILPGEKWRFAIRRAIRDGAHFIACFSREYGTRSRTYMNEELLLAVDELRKRQEDTSWFIPVRLDECEIPEWNLGGGQALTDIQWVDLFDDWDDGLRRIILAVTSREPKSEMAGEALGEGQATREEPEGADQLETLARQTEAAVKEIKKLMSTFIPDFDTQFPEDLQGKLISEIRDENIFRLRTSRAIVFGRVSAGKTSTINHLLSEDIFPASGELSCTRSLAAGEHEGGLIFYDSPGIVDDPQLENVTRAALSIDQLDEAAATAIRLIDITSRNSEGPSSYKVLQYEDFKDEISAEYYSRNRDRVVVKEFQIVDFEKWAPGRFDFLIFVMRASNGLGHHESRFLQDLYVAQGHKTKLFKVMNVDAKDYRDKVGELDAGIQNRYRQAIRRLSASHLPEAEQWFVIDAWNGRGISSLIQALGETLSVHVLRQLEKAVKSDYSHLIRARIESRFCDYVARVACLVAVFPVDFTARRKNLMSFAIKSLIVMAEFMFGSAVKEVSAGALDDLISEIINRKTFIPSYEKEVVHIKRRSGSQFIDRLWDFVPVYRHEEVERSVLAGYHTGIGGIDAVELTVAVGMVLRAVYNAPRVPEIGDDQLRREVARGQRKIKRRDWIIERLKVAGRWEHKRAEISEEIFSDIRASFG